MKRHSRKLSLNRETIRQLSNLQVRGARGGQPAESTGVPCLSYAVCRSEPIFMCDSEIIPSCIPTTTE